jgi:hypothetical protein
VFIIVVVYFVIHSVRKLLDTPLYLLYLYLKIEAFEHYFPVSSSGSFSSNILDLSDGIRCWERAINSSTEVSFGLYLSGSLYRN